MDKALVKTAYQAAYVIGLQKRAQYFGAGANQRNSSAARMDAMLAQMQRNGVPRHGWQPVWTPQQGSFQVPQAGQQPAQQSRPAAQPQQPRQPQPQQPAQPRQQQPQQPRQPNPEVAKSVSQWGERYKAETDPAVRKQMVNDMRTSIQALPQEQRADWNSQMRGLRTQFLADGTIQSKPRGSGIILPNGQEWSRDMPKQPAQPMATWNGPQPQQPQPQQQRRPKFDINTQEGQQEWMRRYQATTPQRRQEMVNNARAYGRTLSGDQLNRFRTTMDGLNKQMQQVDSQAMIDRGYTGNVEQDRKLLDQGWADFQKNTKNVGRGGFFNRMFG